MFVILTFGSMKDYVFANCQYRSAWSDNVLLQLALRFQNLHESANPVNYFKANFVMLFTLLANIDIVRVQSVRLG
jgi:hypothetical protein